MGYTTDERFSLRRQMSTAISDKVRDPSGWNLAARGVAETLCLNVTRISFHHVLDLTCGAIVEEAEKHGRPVAAVRAAVESL